MTLVQIPTYIDSEIPAKKVKYLAKKVKYLAKKVKYLLNSSASIIVSHPALTSFHHFQLSCFQLLARPCARAHPTPLLPNALSIAIEASDLVPNMCYLYGKDSFSDGQTIAAEIDGRGNRGALLLCRCKSGILRCFIPLGSNLRSV